MEPLDRNEVPKPSSLVVNFFPDPDLSLTPDKFFSHSDEVREDEKSLGKNPRKPRSLFPVLKKKGSHKSEVQELLDKTSELKLDHAQKNTTLDLQKKLQELVQSDLDVSKEFHDRYEKDENLRKMILTKASNQVNIPPDEKQFKDLNSVDIRDESLKNFEVRYTRPITVRKKDSEPDILDSMFDHLYPQYEEKPIISHLPKSTKNLLPEPSPDDEIFSLYYRLYRNEFIP